MSVWLLPCSCLNRPSRMFEYCTWLTNAAGDKQGSLSLCSHSMVYFLNVEIILSDTEWMGVLLYSTVEENVPLKSISNPRQGLEEKSFVHPKCLGLSSCSWLLLPPVLFFIYRMSHLVQWTHSSECMGSGFFQWIISNKTEEQNVL